MIVYNQAGGANGDEALILMGIDNPVVDGPPGIAGTAITIPTVFVQRSTGLLLRDGAAPVTARAAAVFNGWGYLRFFDISDPANPVQLGTFATENTNNEAVALDGTWSVHNPELLREEDDDESKTLYVSWYNDGVRVLDIDSRRGRARSHPGPARALLRALRRSTSGASCRTAASCSRATATSASTSSITTETTTTSSART